MNDTELYDLLEDLMWEIWLEEMETNSTKKRDGKNNKS